MCMIRHARCFACLSRLLWSARITFVTIRSWCPPRRWFSELSDPVTEHFLLLLYKTETLWDKYPKLKNRWMCYPESFSVDINLKWYRTCLAPSFNESPSILSSGSWLKLSASLWSLSLLLMRDMLGCGYSRPFISRMTCWSVFCRKRIGCPWCRTFML